MEDHELVALCQQGHKAQFGVLVERYQRLVFGLVYQMTRSREEAEDIAQEAFLRVYQKMTTGAEIEFLPYVRTVATNLTLDRLRRRRSAKLYVEKSSDADVTEYRTPEKDAMACIEHQILRSAMAKLPDMYREVIILHYSAGLAYEQIAQKLDEPMSIVKNRIYRGKKLLKEIYIEMGGNACEV
jgi:RNA polymerase sigma-70 factor (ECF subfamily)